MDRCWDQVDSDVDVTLNPLYCLSCALTKHLSPALTPQVCALPPSVISTAYNTTSPRFG